MLAWAIFLCHDFSEKERLLEGPRATLSHLDALEGINSNLREERAARWDFAWQAPLLSHLPVATLCGTNVIQSRCRPACACLFAVPASLATTASPAPTRLRYLITSLPHNSSLLDGRVNKQKSIPSLWRDKHPEMKGLQSTSQCTPSG